jgi:hypothetical protein
VPRRLPAECGRGRGRSKGTCKQIAGRITGIAFEEQAIDIRLFDRLPTKGILTEPARFYANDSLFRDLVQIAASAWSKFPAGAEGHFYIQGRVLLHFELPSRLDMARAFGEVKYSPENPGGVAFGTNKDFQTVSTLCAILNRLAGRCHPK